MDLDGVSVNGCWWNFVYAILSEKYTNKVKMWINWQLKKGKKQNFSQNSKVTPSNPKLKLYKTIQKINM